MAAADVLTGGVILVVETPPVRNLIGTVLEKQGYDLRLGDVEGGQKLLTSQAVGEIDLLITNEPWSFEPLPASVPVLYISGAPDRDFLQKHRSRNFGYLQKPFRFHELLGSVTALLQKARQ